MEECCRDRAGDGTENASPGTCGQYQNTPEALNTSCGLIEDPDGSGNLVRTHFDPSALCNDYFNCTRDECCNPLAEANTFNCDNSEPDLTNSFMEDIPPNGCDGTSYRNSHGETCQHTCNAGYSGGGISCRADATYQIIPCNRNSPGSCSDWVARYPTDENINICHSDPTKIFNYNGVCADGVNCNFDECCRDRVNDGSEVEAPGTCGMFSTNNPLFGCPYNTRFNLSATCIDGSSCTVNECCEDICGGISGNNFPIPVDQHDKFTYNGSEMGNGELCDRIGVGERCNVECNGNSALDDGSNLMIQYACDTKGQTFGSNALGSNPDPFDHRFCYRDGETPPRTCSDTTSVGNTGTKTRFPCPWWRAPPKENIICEDQIGNQGGCNIDECCSAPISTTTWYEQDREETCTDTCNRIDMTCNTGDWGIHDEVSFRNVMEGTCTGAADTPVCGTHTVSDGCPPGCNNDGTTCNGTADTPTCDWNASAGGGRYCPIGCTIHDGALNIELIDCQGGYSMRPDNGPENVLPVVIKESPGIQSVCYFNAVSQESSCDERGGDPSLSPRLCKCDPGEP